MFEKIFNRQLAKKKSEEIFAHVSGEIVEMDKVPDPIFSKRIMGEGIAVMPSDGKIVAPADGEIIMITDTKHAIGLRTPLGAELLIHIGLETVRLNGEGFNVITKPGDKVVKGQLLVEVDLDYIKQNGYNTVIPIVITNNTQGEYDIQWEKEKEVRAGEIRVFTINKN